MATYLNVSSATVQLADMGLSLAPAQSLAISDRQANESASLAEALQQGLLAMTDGGSWIYAGARKPSSETVIGAMTVLAVSSGVSDPFWTGVYERARVYVALSSGDLTWQYQSSPDGGGSWFTHAELAPVAVSAGLVSVALQDLGIYGRLQWSSVSGATFAARVTLKS